MAGGPAIRDQAGLSVLEVDHGGARRRNGQRLTEREVSRQRGDEAPQLSGARGRRWRLTRGQGGAVGSAKPVTEKSGTKTGTKTSTKPAPVCCPGRRRTREEEVGRKGGSKGVGSPSLVTERSHGVRSARLEPSWGQRQTLTENEMAGQ